jgi:hypothetical protein
VKKLKAQAPRNRDCCSPLSIVSNDSLNKANFNRNSTGNNWRER